LVASKAQLGILCFETAWPDPARRNCQNSRPICATFPMEAAIVNSPEANLEEPRLVLRRVVIEGLEPEIDGGEYPIKRTVGERVVVEADIHADGHDVLDAVVLYRPDRESAWSEAVMRPLPNDR